MTVIYQSSDLNQHGRAILDAARRGQARIRDKDGTSLLVVPEERIEAFEATNHYLTNLLTIESFVTPAGGINRQFVSMCSWPWLAHLDDDDIELFVAELRNSVLAALKTKDLAPTEQLVVEWRFTAEELLDPVLRRVLLKPFDPSAYVEVHAPVSPNETNATTSSDRSDPTTDS